MRLLSMLMLILVLTGCSATKSGGQVVPPGAADVPPSEVVSEEVMVSGIHLGSTMAEVEKALGQPDSVEDWPRNALKVWVYPAKGLHVSFHPDNLVYSFEITAPSPARIRTGIGIGDAVEDVERSYGPPKNNTNRDYRSVPISYVTPAFNFSQESGMSNGDLTWILPMTVIRRLDALLEPTRQAAGLPFCNTSPFGLRELKSRAKSDAHALLGALRLARQRLVSAL